MFQQLLNLIEDNIQDPYLDVDFLCEHLHISRTKLYQKIKSISDQSVGEFISVYSGDDTPLFRGW